MKQIINLKPRQVIVLKEIEDKVKTARTGNDYLLVNFGRNNQFIKIAFCKDQTYVVGYNFYNMEFSLKLNIFMRQYPKIVISRLSQFIFNWVNKLNR